MGQRWGITWWEYTGRYGPFRGNISSPIMRNMATGEEIESPQLPFCACFNGNVDARTLEPKDYYQTGADGLAIICIVPTSNGEKTWWYIDGTANNCTNKADKAHRCWVRHGTVGDALHVDKNGHTCAAGAGSIQTGGWHGFLHNGELHE